MAYAKGDTVFNESFASVVEEEGVRRWIGRVSDSRAALGEYEAARERRRAVIALLIEVRSRLERVYAGAGSEADKRAGKAALLAGLADDYARLKASWGGFAGFDRLFAGGINNALLASIASYNAQVPAFRALLERQGGDLAAFYREVKRLAGLSAAERRRHWLAPTEAPQNDGSIGNEKTRQ